MPQFVAVVEQSIKFCWQAANPTSENYIWKKKQGPQDQSSLKPCSITPFCLLA